MSLRRLWPVLAATFLAAPAAQAGPATPHFRFVPDDGSAGLAERLASIAEDKRRYVLGYLGVADERTIEVRVASSDDGIARMAGTERPVKEWVAGLAMSDRGLIVMSARGNEVFHATDVFVHELAHIYLDSAAGQRRLPRWFHEGFAMLVASEDVASRLKSLMDAAATGSFMAPAELADGFPSDGPAVHLAYAQSMMFLRFLDRREGVSGLREVVRQVRIGMPFDLAFEGVYGGTVEDLWSAWERTVNPWSSWVVLLTSAALLWMLISGLFLWAYTRKRGRAALKRKAWEIQEELERARAAEAEMN